MSNKHKISVMISEDKLQEKIAEIGAKISADYEGKEIKLICILKGSIFFCCELAKRITVPVKIDFMQTSSYGSGTTSSGNIVIKKELDESIEGEHVIVVEDIIDSGNTLFRLMPMLEERNPADICICTLLDKPDRREVDIDVKYNGFNIPANVLASIVLPIPGTSSKRICPPASMLVITFFVTSSLPTITFETLSNMSVICI